MTHFRLNLQWKYQMFSITLFLPNVTKVILDFVTQLKNIKLSGHFKMLKLGY